MLGANTWSRRMLDVVGKSTRAPLANGLCDEQHTTRLGVALREG
jgi:hypothetical protein